jgi:hypothetical protein
MPARSPLIRIILAILALAATSMWAQDGLRGALSSAASPSGGVRSPFDWKLAAADFDSDQKPDGALLKDAGVIDGQRVYRIELHLSAGENQNLIFASSDSALAISALDVNRDGMPDLIVEQAFTHKRLQVWLNDGHGNFRQVRVEDFPPVTDTPAKWKRPVPQDFSVALGLPSRTESDQALLLLQVLRFDSSSSHWKSRPEALSHYGFITASHSPRAPPSFLI